MTIPKIPDPVTAATFLKACNALGVPVGLALKDPTVTLRIVGSVPVDVGQQFIDVVCIEGHRPDLSALCEDESALLVAAVWCRLCERARRERRAIQQTVTEQYEEPR